MHSKDFINPQKLAMYISLSSTAENEQRTFDIDEYFNLRRIVKKLILFNIS